MTYAEQIFDLRFFIVPAG